MVEEIFHELSWEVRLSLVKIYIEDTPAACATDQLAMFKQITSKRIKKEILCDKMVLAVSEKCIYALYYNEMFYPADFFNTAAAVDKEL